MRKIFFFVFIFSLLLFSAAKASAATCDLSITPGQDSNGTTIDNHTHNAMISISSKDHIFAAGQNYWVIFATTPIVKPLNNDVDNGLYQGLTAFMVGNNSDVKVNFINKTDISCNGSGSDCTMTLHGVAGNGQLNQSGHGGAVFLAGDYQVIVFSKQQQDTPLCTAKFSVFDTHDYGYNNCQLIIKDEDKLAVNQHITVSAHVWTAPGAPIGWGDTRRVTVELRNSKDTAVLSHPNISPSDLENGIDLGTIDTADVYNMRINYGGGGAGMNGNLEACRRGPLNVCAYGQTGCGIINTQNGVTCLVCPDGTTYQGLDSDYKPVCHKNDASSISDVKVDPKIITCGAGQICVRQATVATVSAMTNCMGAANGDAGEILAPSPICSQFNRAGTQCENINVGLTSDGIALPTDPGGLLSALLGIVLSIAGGISIVLIMISGYRMMISQGDPEKIKDAREQLTAAIIGLLFIIFSLVILQLIGVSILKLPGFNQ